MIKNLYDTWKVLNAKERGSFLKLTIFSLLVSLADIIALAALLWTLHYYLDPAASGKKYLPDVLAHLGPLFLVGCFCLLFALKNLFACLIISLQDHFTSQVATRLSRESLAAFQQTDFRDYIQLDSSVLIRKIAMEPFEFSQQVLSGWQQILTQLSLIAIAVTAILLYNARLFLIIILILVPPAIGIFFLIRKRMADAKDKVRSHNERSYQYLLDASKGYVESRIFQREPFFLDRFMQQRSAFSKQLFRSLTLQQFPSRIIEIFAILGLFLLLMVSKWLDPGNKDLLVTIGAFVAAAYKVIPGMVKIINLAGQVRAYPIAAQKWSTTANNREEKKTEAFETIKILAVENLQFSYDGNDLFNDLSFSLKEGEVLGISGHSGIGKTTLLHLLLGFLSPKEGKILVNGLACEPAKLQKFWPGIAYVKQETFIIHDSITKNVTLEEEIRDPEKLAMAIHISGLDKVGIETGGMDTMLAENGKNISGGQRQRIALARAIYKDPRLLVLDEPFNELDPASTHAILDSLKQWMGMDRMLLIVTHEKDLLAKCDKVIDIHDQ